MINSTPATPVASCSGETVFLPADGNDYCAVARRDHRRLYAVVRRILHSPEEAEDAIQEAHLRALSHLHQFSGRAPLSSWVMQIAAREALTRLRRRVPTVGLDDLPLPSRDRNPEQEAIGAQLLKLILATVQGLPPHYRTVFLLRECCEVDTCRAAACLGLTVECVEMRLYRAKALLRERLRSHLESPSRHGKEQSDRKQIRALPGAFAGQGRRASIRSVDALRHRAGPGWGRVVAS